MKSDLSVGRRAVLAAGAADRRFTPGELAELNAAVAGIAIKGERLPPAVQAFSGVEAPPRTR